jgi:hypothetical protein
MELRLYGELEPWPLMKEMVALLKKAGLTVSVGRYAIHVMDCERFIFQEYGGDLGPPCLDVEAETPERVLADAKLVSDALTKRKLRHRFEIYDKDGEGKMVAYLHYDLPLKA